MKVYLWFLLIVFVLSALGKLYCLYSDDLSRTKGEIACDAAIEIALIAWTAYLIGQ